MAISEKHPSVLKLTSSRISLIDPTLSASSEFSFVSLQQLMAARRQKYILAAIFAFIGLVVGTVLRNVVVPELGLPSGLVGPVGYVVMGLLVAAGLYPFYKQADRITTGLEQFAVGPHAINIGYINNSGLDPTDETPAVALWNVASRIRRMDDALGEFDELQGGDPAAVEAARARLTLDVDDLERRLKTAGLSLDLSDYRADLEVR